MLPSNATVAKAINDIDFGRSYVRFTTDSIAHTPRLQIDAACTLIGADGSWRQYFLTCPCIGERMYVPTGLIHQPPSEFHMIGQPGVEFLMLKRLPSARDDVRSAHRVGEAMPTQHGMPATVTHWEVGLRTLPRLAPIRTCAEFRAALLEDRPMNARTTYELAGERVILDYPAKTVNIGNQDEVWQVDAGPVLMPTEPQQGPLAVTRFNLAYLVFNRWDYAEAAVRRATPLDDAGGAQTSHYSGLMPLQCQNELFASADML